ncbi:MAG: hypothetical protein ACTSPI_13855 [Candidatus Heimdallarchaeaceae archaeon]
MALKKSLKAEENEYYFNFDSAYFKIEDVRINFKKGYYIVHVRGYASKEARDKQKELEQRTKDIKNILMNDDLLEKSFAEQKEYKDEFGYRDSLIKKQEKLDKNIIGIYKKVFRIPLEEVNMQGNTMDDLITACYIWLKNNNFTGAKDV